MKQFIQFTLIFSILSLSAIARVSAQDEKVDFTASWKQDSTKNIITLTLTKGNLPVNCYVYDSSPFTGGKLISKLENIQSLNFDIELPAKSKVYICVYKDEINLAGKWLNINN
jgi:hypothetical protein